MTDSELHLHLVSDATSETINGIARACLSQFDNVAIQEHFWSLIRTRHAAGHCDGRDPSMAGYGLIHLRRRGIAARVDGFLPPQQSAERFRSGAGHGGHDQLFRRSVLPKPRTPTRSGRGLFRAHRRRQFFALAQDDGNRIRKYFRKPMSSWSASHARRKRRYAFIWRIGEILAANVPIVPGIPLAVDLTQVDGPLIVGLTKDPRSLVEIRRSRITFVAAKRNVPIYRS